MKHFFVFLIFFISSQLFAMDWPSAAGVITRNFGWNDRGMPHLGISFASDGVIQAAAAGELLFSRREGDNASRLPSALGVWTALDHGDGIISIYSRFDSSSQAAVPNMVERGFILGQAGISGWSSQRGFYFQLFDRKERRWINPALIATPLVDTRPPVIVSVSLRDEQGNFFNPLQTQTISQGRYTIIVNANDTKHSPNEIPLAPNRIICSVNGREVGHLSFENYSARGGSLMVQRNGLVPVRQVFAHYPAFELADVWLTRGQTTLEIIARDLAGNTRNAVFRLTVE